MATDKLKLDCTGCGSPLFQTNNPQVYKCERCDTSYKVQFDSDGISLVIIEKKIKTYIEGFISFKEGLSKGTLILNCTICNSNLEKSSIPDVYECHSCKMYFKPIFDEGSIKLVYPDEKTINILELHKLQSLLGELKHKLNFAEDDEHLQDGCGFFIFMFFLIMCFLLIHIIIVEWIMNKNTLLQDLIISFPWILLIFPISFIWIWRARKPVKKSWAKVKDLNKQRYALEKKINELEEIVNRN
jgi:ribosomal protein L37AE/L43A